MEGGGEGGVRELIELFSHLPHRVIDLKYF